MKKCQCSKSLFLISIIVICVCSVILFLPVKESSAFAYELNSNSIAQGNSDANYFDNTVSTRWYTEAYRLAYASNDNYSSHTYNAIYPYYYSPSGGITAAAIPLNDEMYSVDGTDNAGATRIQPVLSLGDGNNVFAQGHASITFNNFRGIPTAYNCSMRNDTRAIKNLYSELAISGNNTTVYYGKIMYRTAAAVGANWSGWGYIDLTNGASLYFNGSQCVQIVVIYEIREEAPNIFKPVKYHHVVGIYRFDIV